MSTDNEKSEIPRHEPWRKNTKARLFLVVSVACYILLTFLAVRRVDDILAARRSKPAKRNVIFMVSDGMGPASLSLTRSFRQLRDGLPIDDVLCLDKHLIGASRTRSSSSLITDSAAGATAFSCGLKSYNGAIGVDSDKSPCGTLLEAAKLAGMLTGLVVTTRITDATPAAFSSHVDYRFQEDQIAEQQLGDYPLGRMVDLIIGGGRCHFLPSNLGGCRQDDVNLVKKAQQDGWTYVDDRSSFDELKLGKNVTLPLLALVANGDIPFDLDRNPQEYPSLEEETRTALQALSEASESGDKGFFLLVEGSRIDHAGHENDPSAQVREVLAYDKAFEAVLEFAKNSKDETIVISTSDHETGGLVTARQLSPNYPQYVWYPQALLNACHSGSFLAQKLGQYNGPDTASFIRNEILEKQLQIFDYKEEEVELLLKQKNSAQDAINDIVSKRSQTGWTTHGHSAVDVNIYGYGNTPELHAHLLEKLAGNHENIEMGVFMEQFMHVDLAEVTEKVKNTHHSRGEITTEWEQDEYFHRNAVNY